MKLCPADAPIFVGVEFTHQIPHVRVEVVHMLASDIYGQPQQ